MLVVYVLPCYKVDERVWGFEAPRPILSSRISRGCWHPYAVYITVAHIQRLAIAEIYETRLELTLSSSDVTSPLPGVMQMLSNTLKLLLTISIFLACTIREILGQGIPCDEEHHHSPFQQRLQLRSAPLRGLKSTLKVSRLLRPPIKNLS